MSLFNQLPPMPLLIRIYMGFALFALLRLFAGLIPQLQELNAQLHPFLGWNSTFGYVMGLILIVSSYYPKAERRPDLRILPLFPLFMVLQSSFEIYLVLEGGNLDPDSLYLYMHPYRPFFTVALPALWIGIFCLPHIQLWIAGVRGSIRD